MNHRTELLRSLWVTLSPHLCNLRVVVVKGLREVAARLKLLSPDEHLASTGLFLLCGFRVHGLGSLGFWAQGLGSPRLGGEDARSRGFRFGAMRVPDVYL